MMMKKTTSALAVAALLGTGAASAATFQVNDDTSFSISGDIQVVAQDRENSTTNIQDNGSSIVLSGATNVSGVTTFFALDHDSFDDNFDAVGSSGDGDEGHIGIRGDFGDIRFGKESAAYETLDGLFDYQWDLNTTSVSPGDRARVLQYRNSAGNLSYVLGAQINGEAQEAANGSGTSLAAAASYDLGGVTLTAAYDQRANDTRTDNNGTTTDATFDSDNERVGALIDSTSDDTTRVIDEPVYGVAASFDVQTVSVSVGYQKDADEVNEADIISLSASAPVGGMNLYGVYQTVSYDTAPTNAQDVRGSISADQSDDSFNEFIVGASYGFGPMTFAAEYLTFDNDNDEGDVISLVGYYGF